MPHTHDFTYSASGATITATCKEDGCGLPVVDGKPTATLTIAAPDLTTYGGQESPEAKITDANSIRGSAAVKYYKATKSGDTYAKTSDPALTAAPTDAGHYIAEITLGEGNNSATASIGYIIAKAAGAAATAPAAGEISKTDTTITVKPTKENQEYVIVKKTDPATQPDWANAKPHNADNGDLHRP